MKTFDGKLAHPEFWSREILEYSNGSAKTFAYLSDGLNGAQVLIVIAMREVDSCNVHSCLNKLCEDLWRVGCWANGAHDLCRDSVGSGWQFEATLSLSD